MKRAPINGEGRLRPLFPNSRIESPGVYLDQYAVEVAAALSSIDRREFDLAVAILEDALKRDASIFTCGNGGSAAIANHMACDHQKGIHADTELRPRVISLSSNVEVITAISNDIGFADVFSYSINLHGRSGDVLVTVSSSGNSENIVRAIEAAARLGMETIALTGFDGGRSRELATAAIHVDGWNYGVIEDAHQACMHVMAQFLRLKVIPDELLGQRRF